MRAVAADDSPGVRVLRADPEGCTWVESHADVVFGDQYTKHQAFAQAVMEARTKAMNRLLGVHLEHQFIDFQQENSLKGEATLTEHLLRATQLGRIVREKVLTAGLVNDEGCVGCRFQVAIHTCIVPEPERNDKDFSVQLRLNRSSYIDGDDAVISVTSSRDAYIYIYGIDMNVNGSLIFPNMYARDNHIRAGEIWTFPNQELQSKGVYARVKLHTGDLVSAEMVRVIASKTPLPLTLVEPMERRFRVANVQTTEEVTGEGSFLGLMRKLMASNAEWVEDAQAFTIRQE